MKALACHVHLMRFRPDEHVWVTDEMSELRHDFLPDDLDPLLTAAGFDSCIAVEARQLPLENQWLVELASHWPRIAAVVGWVDLRARDIGTQLDQLNQQSMTKRFRHVVTDEPPGFLDDPAVRAGIAELGRRHYVCELLVLPEQLHGAADLAASLPDQQSVLDHAGLLDIRGGGYLAWAAGLTAIARPRGFWAGTPTRPGRFHPFTPAGAPGPVPVLYGSDRLAGAISETVFHDVPVRGTKHVPRATLRRKLAITLTATRDLRLADLTGYGLRRLGATRAEIIDSDPRSYQHTAKWAHGLHAHREHLDGIQWVSRQYDTAVALILFGDRVRDTELHIAITTIPMPLASVSGTTTCRTLPTKPTSPLPEHGSPLGLLGRPTRQKAPTEGGSTSTAPPTPHRGRPRAARRLAVPALPKRRQ